MSRWTVTFCVAAIFTLAGCGLFGEDSSCGKTLGEVERGGFAVRVESTSGCKMARNGSARFDYPVEYTGPVEPSGEAPETFLLRFTATGERGTTIWAGMSGDERPEEGVYRLADLTKSTPFLGIYEFRDGRFSIAAAIQGQLGYTFSKSGTLTITRSEEGLVEGSFEATLFREEGYEDEPQEVTLKGRFSATRHEGVRYTSFY